jgi:hypothetical protein
MSDFSLMGCLHQYQVLSAAADELILEGPIFTADKINRNGWGISSSEAKGLARSPEGKPIRYCPQGKHLPGIPAAHTCDAKQTEQDIVGEILKVYPAGQDDKGHQVYAQLARITDPATIKGIMAGSAPGS